MLTTSRDLNEMLAKMHSVVDKVDHLNEIYSLETLAKSDHLAQKAEDDEQDSWNFFVSPLMGDNITKSIFGGAGFLPEDTFMKGDEFVTVNKENNSYKDIT